MKKPIDIKHIDVNFKGTKHKILTFLWHNGTCNTNLIAKKLNMRKNSVSSRLSALRQSGIVSSTKWASNPKEFLWQLNEFVQRRSKIKVKSKENNSTLHVKTLRVLADNLPKKPESDLVKKLNSLYNLSKNWNLSDQTIQEVLWLIVVK